jgi:DNA-binding NarL/FixJ family response regulator
VVSQGRWLVKPLDFSQGAGEQADFMHDDEYPESIKTLHANRKLIKQFISQGQTFRKIAKTLSLAVLDVKMYIRYNDDFLVAYRKAQSSLECTKWRVLTLVRQGASIDAIAIKLLLHASVVKRIIDNEENQ